MLPLVALWHLYLYGEVVTVRRFLWIVLGVSLMGCLFFAILYGVGLDLMRKRWGDQ